MINIQIGVFFFHFQAWRLGLGTTVPQRRALSRADTNAPTFLDRALFLCTRRGGTHYMYICYVWWVVCAWGRMYNVESAKPPPGPVLGLSATATLYSTTGLFWSAHHITMVSSWQLALAQQEGSVAASPSCFIGPDDFATERCSGRNDPYMVDFWFVIPLWLVLPT